MHVFCPVALLAIGLGVSGCRQQSAQSRFPRYEVLYYDRNGDGIVDYELHHAPGWSGADWALVDTTYHGFFDLLVEFGDLRSAQWKIHAMVPGHVRISKDWPAGTNFGSSAKKT